jgi:hypothetical protein
MAPIELDMHSKLLFSTIYRAGPAAVSQEKESDAISSRRRRPHVLLGYCSQFISPMRMCIGQDGLRQHGSCCILSPLPQPSVASLVPTCGARREERQ